jgi:hypothetical protein
MDIMDFITAGPNLAFLIAGCIVVALLALALVSAMVGVGHDLLHIGGDIDFSADLNGNGIPDYLELHHFSLTTWLNPGHIPSTVFTILFCGIYSIVGFSSQWIYDGLTGALAPGLLATPLVAALVLPLVRGSSEAIAPLIPRDESSAISVDTLVGSSGVITAGPIGPDDFGMARFTDQHGTDHNLMVCGDGEEYIANGAAVVLIGPHKHRDIAFVVRKI